MFYLIKNLNLKTKIMIRILIYQQNNLDKNSKLQVYYLLNAFGYFIDYFIPLISVHNITNTFIYL